MAECMNWTLLNRVCAMLRDSQLSDAYWYDTL